MCKYDIKQGFIVYTIKNKSYKTINTQLVYIMLTLQYMRKKKR